MRLVYAGEQLIEALHYKLEGRRFDSRWGHRINPSSRTVVLELTQFLTEKSNSSIISGGKFGWSVGVDNQPMENLLKT
jgi:hypothetical protein